MLQRLLGSNPESKLRDWASWDKLESNGQIQTNAYVKANQKANILLQVVASEWGAVNGPTIIGNRYSHGSLLSKTETLQAPGPWGDVEMASMSAFGSPIHFLSTS